MREEDPGSDVQPDLDTEETEHLFGRRDLLSGAAGLAALALGGPGWTAEGAGLIQGTAGEAAVRRRLRQALNVRVKAAHLQCDVSPPRQEANGDEDAHPGRVASFSKGLPHDDLGQVDPRAYDLLLRALRTGSAADFERIPIGGRVKLANPQAALSFSLIGPDPCLGAIDPAPRFDSARQAGEMVEMYWHALTRDVLFSEYGSHPLVQEASEELSGLSDFHGPKEGGRVTPRTIFRGDGAGDLAGSYVSQLLLKDVPFTPIRFPQKIRTVRPADDYLTDFASWLASQNGNVAGANRYDPEPRYVRNGRDLAEYVHRDFSYQAPLAAGLILLRMGTLTDAGNPYQHSRTQSAFATFGAPYFLYLLALVTQVALTVCWYPKWMVHRRLRPEEFAGRVEQLLKRRAAYPIHAEVIRSRALQRVLDRWSTGLLPQTYPEGSPMHPSYPSGHAVIAGAGVTVLKAIFQESFVIPEPVETSPDGLSLRRYEGPPLTVGGELDKLASNVAFGRNFAGIHWRSDAAAGLRLGEAVAISILKEMKLTGNEIFDGFDLRTFDGKRVTV
jgi:membrane-associated phospholipid phosphatase